MGEMDDKKPLKIPTRDKVGAPLMKRFYKNVEAVETSDDFEIHLDGRPVKSASGAIIRLPSQKLAEIIQSEWAAQEEHILPETMPYHQLAQHFTGVDAETVEAAKTEILAYAANDLLCYRAERPQALRTRQDEAWDPILEWSKTNFGTRFEIATGILHVEQPTESIAQISKTIEPLDDFQTLILLRMTKSTGSALLALARTRGFVTSDRAWSASRIDETWQAEQWGQDEEAKRGAAIQANDFTVAADFFDLLKKAV